MKDDVKACITVELPDGRKMSYDIGGEEGELTVTVKLYGYRAGAGGLKGANVTATFKEYYDEEDKR